MGHRTISGARLVAVALAALLAVAGLTACRTNVGSAATVDGHRISETRVNDYLTDDAKPISSSDGSSSIAPRSFVLLFLIDERLATKLLSTPPAKAPTAAQLSTAIASAVKQSGGRAAVIKGVGLAGYTTSFQDLFIRTSVLQIVLHQQAGDTQNQASIAQIANALKFDPAKSFRVSVNPRYGTWDTKTLTLNSVGGVPSYLKLQTAAAS